MGDVELKALVAREISLAEDGQAPRSKKATRALQYYQGVMEDVPAEVGRSKVTSRDLADTMGWMLPGIIRVFTASEHMAIAEPVGAEDDKWSKQATDGLNYVFWKENDGYRIIYNATWDSLLSANGVVKTWWDDTPEEEISTHTGLDSDQYLLLTEPDEVEVLAHSERDELIEVGPGEQVPTIVHDVKIRRTSARAGRIRVEAIPPEDYGKDSESKTCDESRFQYHRERKTRSELIEMGFERKKVDTLAKAADVDSSEESARQTAHIDSDGDKSMDIVDVYECYLKADIDGDGIAELCQVYYAGNSGGGEILSWEEWDDENPFDDIPCNPMPHRWEAQGIDDETIDVQQIKTVLLRQALDNTYATNNPQRFVTGKIINPDELFSPSFGGAVFGETGSTVTPLTVPFVANHAYDAINYMDQTIERRTGVSRTTMALDPEALQNQSATANQNAHDAAYSQIELVARNQAELGWKKVFRKILRLMIKHQDAPRDVRMRGQSVKIDPRFWNADMDVSINVGLGTGSRDRDMQMLQLVKADQIGLAERFAAGGFPDKALDMLPFIMTTMNKSAEAAGIKSPEQFFPEISPEEIAAGKEQIKQMQGQPDPKIQLEQEKAKADIAIQQEKTAADAQNMQAKLQMDQQKGEQEIMLKREQLAAEMQLKREQLVAEMQLKRELSMAEMNIKREVGFYSADAKASAGSSGVHMGGEPG